MNANLLLCHTLVPWNGKSCHFCMAINLDKYQQRHAAHDKVLYQELSLTLPMPEGRGFLLLRP